MKIHHYAPLAHHRNPVRAISERAMNQRVKHIATHSQRLRSVSPFGVRSNGCAGYECPVLPNDGIGLLELGD